MAESTIRGTSILEQLGINASDVLQSQNVESTLTTPEAPVNDALGIFTAQEEAQGVSGLKTAYQEAQKNFLSAQNLANQEQLTIQGRAKKLGVLRGEQAQAAGQANVDLQTLQTAQNLAGSALSSAQATATQRANILYGEYQQKVNIQLQYPGIKIDPLNDTFDEVSEKVEKYQKKKADSAYKKELQAQLRAMGKSIKTSKGGTLSIKGLEKKLAKVNKEALEQAKQRSEQEWEMEVAKFNKSMSGGSGSKPSALQATADAYNKFNGDWGQTANYLANQGYDVSSGSAIDNELRRRAGLSPVGGASSAPKKIGQDENGEDIFIDASGNRVKWVD